MADDFDPYYTWLGIPPEEQPADHYRLLGVRRFESNADVITNAMDQRMHYLRSLQVGKRSALSQKILNEVSSAGVVLLDPKRRAEYDQQIKCKEAKDGKTASAGAPAATSPPAAPPAAAPKTTRPLPVASSLPKAAPLPLPAAGSSMSASPASVVVTSAPAGREEKQPAKPWPLKSPVVLGGASFAAVAIIGLVGLIVVKSMQGPKPNTDRNNNGTVTEKRPGKDKPKNGGTADNTKKPKQPVVDPVIPVAAWVKDADSRQLFVLDFDKRASMEIDQTAPWVSLAKNTTIEGWFKLRLDTPQTMSLFGTRSGGSSGQPPQGWMLVARRAVESEKMADQLLLEVWKNGGQVVQFRSPLPRPTEWHHVALVSSAAKEWLLYVDGKEAFRYPAESGLTVSGADLHLGDDVNRRGGGLEGQVCGLRLSDTVRYEKPFSPPSPLAMTHDKSTAATLHFTMAVPDAAAGTIQGTTSQWQYGYGRYDEEMKKVAAFAPMREWNGLMWRPGASLPHEVSEWMFLDPLGGHAGKGQEHAVIRRWTAPLDGTLEIAGKLTHAHEQRFGDGIHGRVVSSSAGQVGQWSALIEQVDTPVEKLQVHQGDQIDFVVECQKDNFCDKFAWPVQLVLSGADGKPLGEWDSQREFQGPDQARAVYQLARLNGARWQRLDPSLPVALTQLAPIGSTPSAGTQPPVNLIEEYLGQMQVLRGSISRSGSSLLMPQPVSTAFVIPVDSPVEYVLQAEVIRLSGDESICFGLPLPGNRRVTAIVDGMKGTVSGFASVNGKQIFTNDNPLARQGGLLTNGQPAVIQIEVRQSGVTLTVNGAAIAQWQSQPTDQTTTAKGMGFPGQRGLAVMTWNSPYRLNRLELIPLSPGSAAPPPSASAGRVELVQKHRDAVQVVRGSVTHSHAAGWQTEASGTGFTIPEPMPEEYVVEAEVVREDGSGSISFHLPVRGKALSAIIDIYDSRLTGLSDINDWNIQSRDNPTVHRGPVLTNGQAAQVRIVVSRQEISLSVDGKKLSSWPYDPGARLVAYQGLRLPDLSKLGITTGNSKFRIKRVEMSPGAGPSSSVGPLASAGAIDLIDARRRTVRGIEGVHTVTANVLTTGLTKSRVAVDHDLPDEYTLEAEVTRLSGNDTLGFGIPVQGRPLSILIDGWNSDRSGICIVPGQDRSDPGGETIQKGSLLTNGKPARLRIFVSREEVQFAIDDKTIARWSNDPSATLRAFGGYEPDGRKLAIGSYSPYRIANLKLIPASSSSQQPDPPPAALAGAKKEPIPTDEAKAKAQTQIAAVFGDELKGAKTPPAKAAVARKISDLARETKDLATKYVMLEEARRLFVELKDVASALQTVDALSAQFDVAPLPAKVKLLQTIGEGTLSAAQRAEIVNEACTLGYEAIDSDQFETAKALSDVVRSAAARATAADVKADAKEFIDEFTQRQKRWDAVRRAEQAAAANPDDPAANLALGLYHMFDRGDQAKGLGMLAKGSDAKLAAAAKARQESVSKGLAGSLAEADAWFDCISTVTAEYKAAVQKRALEAYDLAAGSASGLEKAKAEKRRDQLKVDLGPAAPSASKRGPRIRKSELPESSPGMVGRVFLGGKDAGILVTFDPQRTMDTQKLRNILGQAKLPGGRIILEGTLTCPTPMSMYVSHRGASTAATQQVLVNGKVLSSVGGNRSEFDSERLQLVAGNHLIQWNIEFDGSTSPYLHIYEDGNSRRVPLNFSRDQNYGARKATTTQELDLSQ
jgi:hypothetical protein